MRAFSLIELIFVIIIMGILTFTGLQFIPDETLTVDTQMLKNKILQTKSNALGYHNNDDTNYTCITLITDNLNESEANQKVKYTFKSEINAPDLNPDKRLCFDYLGRPYNGIVTNDLTNLLHNDINITIEYRNKNKIITLYPITGAIKVVR